MFLSEKTDGLGWRNRKINERSGTGDQKKQMEKHRKCDMLWEVGVGGPGAAELGLNHVKT